MGLPRDAEARRYYRAAMERLKDAELLLDAGRTTGGIYLAGYTVECLLKAVILAGVPNKLCRQLTKDFRGQRAHDIEWLGDAYRRWIGSVIPRQVMRHLARVATWTTDLRYEPRLMKPIDADEFFESVRAVMAWSDERI